MIKNILLGTYTRNKSEGIYQIQLDTEKGVLDNLTLVTKETSPTYLTKSQAGNLYSVTTQNDEGGASSYDAKLNFLNAVTEEGAPLCYVAVDEDRQLLYGANYHKGEVNVYHIKEDGSLDAAAAVYHDEETGPHKNQNTAHVHYTDLTPDNRLVVCDLGTDHVQTYDVDQSGSLTEVAAYVTQPGCGPRHLVFHPQEDIAYLFGELDNTVAVLAYNSEDGSFSLLQTISTVPDDFTGESAGAAIRISKDGKFLYASNRGHNSIVVYQISEDGKSLETIQFISTEGDGPRDFNLSPENDYVVCGNQNTDNLSLYRRDAATGLLELLQKDIYAPECVCVYFD
ncbi:lactonase family protein [Enterococcus sp. 669A]|uniref:Lactonase family protein n=1 Tax=Candidatus Enterococcus moelleringii TaxID=2815325 RepID=A0ABS3L5Q7_9ENTE|nr:lactonase family protein [Enterococcus sp. 669A]MBO1304943.1 lactonase family protein [Enterococcus sp. 669A]